MEYRLKNLIIGKTIKGWHIGAVPFFLMPEPGLAVEDERRVTLAGLRRDVDLPINYLNRALKHAVVALQQETVFRVRLTNLHQKSTKINSMAPFRPKCFLNDSFSHHL